MLTTPARSFDRWDENDIRTDSSGNTEIAQAVNEIWLCILFLNYFDNWEFAREVIQAP